MIYKGRKDSICGGQNYHKMQTTILPLWQFRWQKKIAFVADKPSQGCNDMIL